MNRSPVRCHIYGKQSDSQLGFDFMSFVEDPKSTIKSVTKSVESKTKSYAKDYIPEKYYDKVSAAVKKQGAKVGEQIKEKGTEFAMSKVQAYTAQPEVQESAIRGGITAMADQISNVAVDVNKTFQTEGVGGVFKKYPIPFYAVGGIATLLTLRFVLGKRK